MSVSIHISFLSHRWGFLYQSLQEFHSQLPAKTFGISMQKSSRQRRLVDSEVQDTCVCVLSFTGDPSSECSISGVTIPAGKKHLCFYITTSTGISVSPATVQRLLLIEDGDYPTGSWDNKFIKRWKMNRLPEAIVACSRGHLPVHKCIQPCALTQPAVPYTWVTCNT